MNARMSRLTRRWRGAPNWLRVGGQYAALYLVLTVFSRVSQPPWPWLPGNPQQQALANEAFGLSLALGLVSYISLPALRLLAPGLSRDAGSSPGVSRWRRVIIALALATLPWCALAVAFRFPNTLPLVALTLPLGYVALVLGVGAAFLWSFIQLPNAFEADQRHGHMSSTQERRGERQS